MCTFGERLKRTRREAGYVQKDMAKLLNMSTSGYGLYETNDRQPSFATVKKLAEFLDVSADYLLDIIDTPNHKITYPMTEELSLNEAEVQVVKEMKKSLLEKITDQPEENVKQLERFWNIVENKDK